MDRLKLLDAGLRAFDARLPDVAPPLCVATRYRASSCRRCLDVCPGDAIEPSPWLRVEPDRCSSCGACAARCPTGALSFGARADLLREQCAAAASRHNRVITLACRFVAGDARGDGATVVVLPCLGGLSAADLIGAAAAGVVGATLLCGDCESCSDRLAGASLGTTVEIARETVDALGCGFTVDCLDRPSHTSIADPTSSGLSRRDLFSFLARGARRTAAEGLATERRTVSDLHAQAGPPTSHRRLLADLDKLSLGCRERPTVIPRALPLGALVVSEGCNGCGLCARYCPHGALVVRDGSLSFDRCLCTSCGLCVEVCPFGAMALGSDKMPREWSLSSPQPVGDAQGSRAGLTEQPPHLP